MIDNSTNRVKKWRAAHREEYLARQREYSKRRSAGAYVEPSSPSTPDTQRSVDAKPASFGNQSLLKKLVEQGCHSSPDFVGKNLATCGHNVTCSPTELGDTFTPPMPPANIRKLPDAVRLGWFKKCRPDITENTHLTPEEKHEQLNDWLISIGL